VAAFKAANPGWADGFYPFEDDCISGKIVDPLCEQSVKDQLALLEDEIKLEAKKKLVNAKEARVNAKEARVNAQLEMVNRTTIVTVVLQLNNSIHQGNPDRSGIAALDRIKNPILQADIIYLRSIDTKLTQKKTIAPGETAQLQTILITQAQESLRIYSTFTPEQQQRFIDTKIIAV